MFILRNCNVICLPFFECTLNKHQFDWDILVLYVTLKSINFGKLNGSKKGGKFYILASFLSTDMEERTTI